MQKKYLTAALAGIAGGAAGLFVMKYAMQGTLAAMKRTGMTSDEDDGQRAEGSESDGSQFMSITGFEAREGEPATGALARMVYERVKGEDLDEDLEESLSNWVHRGYGETMGLAYALAASGRGYGVKGGVLFGLLLFLLGDEVMVPLLGLSKKPTVLPAEMHVPALAAHLAYGAALGAVVDGVDRLSSSNAG